MIVKTGKADVYIKGTESAVASLMPGDFIGDYQLLFDTINQVGVRTPDFTEVLILAFLEFEAVCDHPNFSFLEFRKLGGNFRGSSDKGALETFTQNKERMQKLAVTIGNVNTSSKKNKLKEMMQKTELIVHGLMIYPNSKWHVFFDCVKLFATLYYFLAIPLRLCWNVTGGGWPSNRPSGSFDLSDSYDNTLLMDWLIDLVFLADMVLHLRFFAYTSYSAGRSEVVTDRDRIYAWYTKSDKFKVSGGLGCWKRRHFHFPKKH